MQAVTGHEELLNAILMKVLANVENKTDKLEAFEFANRSSTC